MRVIIFGVGAISNYIKDRLPAGTVFQHVVTKRNFLEPTSDASDEIEYIDDVELFHYDAAYIAIGYKHLELRAEILKKFRESIAFPNLLDADHNKSVDIGIGNIIMNNAIIERGVSLGNGNIIWSGAQICHDVMIGNSNFFAAGCKIGGYATIENYTMFGFNAVVCDKSTVPSNTTVNALNFFK